VEALGEAFAWFGKPGTFNTDQGAQFTSDEFTKVLRDQTLRTPFALLPSGAPH
jgi:putative transposase